MKQWCFASIGYTLPPPPLPTKQTFIEKQHVFNVFLKHERNYLASRQ